MSSEEIKEKIKELDKERKVLAARHEMEKLLLRQRYEIVYAECVHMRSSYMDISGVSNSYCRICGQEPCF